MIGRAVMVVHANPLVVGVPALIPSGRPRGAFAPATNLPLMLKRNGEWVLRADWELVVDDGDVIEWHLLPQGGAGSRGLLQVILLVAAVAYGAYTGDWATAAKIYAIGSAVLSVFNILVPIRQPDRNSTTTSPGSVYNVQLAGNQARLNQPIPVIYGRMKTFPDFAGQAYGEYQNNDQFFNAVYCVGQGNFNFESLLIANSPISSFSDVQYQILPPGTLPSLCLANVYNAPEAAGQDLKTGISVGGFAACGPGKTVAAVGVDILLNAGLYSANSSGTLSNQSVVIKNEAQAIDDWGVAIGDWYTLGTETITRHTQTPQRLSFKYTLASAARVQVRATRIDAFVDNAQVQNSPVLGGLRGYLSGTPGLCPTATHIEIRIRATAQLSSFSQSKVSCTVRRKLRTWSPAGGGTWSAEVETRSIAWALADVWTNTVYGDGLADARVDLQTLYDLDAIWMARQDRCDLLTDSKVTSWDAATTIAQCGRARPFRRAGVCSLFRDQQTSLPVTAFTSRNILPGLDLGYSLATEITADGIVIEYFSSRSWQYESIVCPAPGVVTPLNAPRVRIMGITGSIHAKREGLYQAAQNLYRRKFPKWQTELTGLLPAYGSLVLYSPDLPGYGQAGDVADFNVSTLVMNLTEPAVFTPGASAHYISLMRDDGSMTSAIACSPGPTANDVVLATLPDFTLVMDSPDRERPKYIFGAAGQHRIPVRVLGITKRGKGQGGEQIIEMTGVNEDDRIHAVDNAFLPGPGDIQDPVGGGTVSSSLNFSTIVTLSASSNVGATAVNGVRIDGLNPAASYALDLPAGLVYEGWSPWSSDYDSGVPSPPNAWGNCFQVTNNTSLAVTTFGSNAIAASASAARIAFAGGTITGSASFTFWLQDTGNQTDNRGGMAVRLTKL